MESWRILESFADEAKYALFRTHNRLLKNQRGLAAQDLASEVKAHRSQMVFHETHQKHEIKGRTPCFDFASEQRAPFQPFLSSRFRLSPEVIPHSCSSVSIRGSTASFGHGSQLTKITFTLPLPTASFRT
jgi:hypothetical protein